jgi:hypothetical protein
MPWGADELGAAELARLDEDGFLVIESFVSAEEVERLRTVYDRLFGSDAGRAEGKRIDLVGAESPGAPNLPQIIEPSRFAPELRSGEYVARARSLARAFLGEDLLDGFGDHMIFKPPGAGAATPWHQDAAYHDPTKVERSINFWMPLDDADLDNGCLHYVPGSHRSDVLPHHSIGNDPRVHGLEVDHPESWHERSVACPIAAGGCALHLPTTLHYAGPNRSARQRRAYTLIMHAPSLSRTMPIDNYWMGERHENFGGK